MKLFVCKSSQTNPYWNIAVENSLQSRPAADAVTLYLWKNRRTVVIGQNQNPYAECNVDLLQNDGGYVMRRSTGGGAVYHDDGNINFSFIAPPGLYDQKKQFSVLQKAVESYGLETELSGRNDVLCEGRKFSGNAFSKGVSQYLHHGTILIKGNMEDLQKYLKVKPAKLQKHGVRSVQSRVVNLSELADVTSENIVPRLIDAFESEYGGKAEILDFEKLLQEEDVRNRYARYSSEEWLFARWRTFRAQCEAQFGWGNIEIALKIDEVECRIREVEIASDSLSPDTISLAKELLTGASTQQPPSAPPLQQLTDIFSLVYGQK